MNIRKMLTLNKSHFKENTLELIDVESNVHGIQCFNINRVGPDGYLIGVHKDNFEANVQFKSNIPVDLETIVALALDIGCEVIYIDESERELSYLPVYRYTQSINDFYEKISVERCYCGNELVYERELKS